MSTRIQIRSGQTISVPLEPRTGPTEAVPTWTIQATILDQSRNTPVKADRVRLGEQELARNVSEFRVQLPGDIRESPLLLQIEAAGYEPWSVVLRHKVNYSRIVTAQAQPNFHDFSIAKHTESSDTGTNGTH
jgi:hypothetical protein